MNNESMLPSLETKSSPAEVSSAFEEFHRAFTAFREANDERLAQLETRWSSDVVTEEKVARIERALDDQKRRVESFALDRARPRLGVEDPARDDASAREHKRAFLQYMRGGDAAMLLRLEGKALSAGSGADGGYLVPPPAEQEILRRMTLASPIRSLASVRTISGPSLRKAYSTSGPAAGWTAETDQRVAGATQKIADMTFPAMELYAMPAATQTLLDDAVIDVEQWIAEEVQAVFAEQESAAFVNGDGVNKPKGFLSAPRVAEDEWAWGAIGYVPSGAAGAFATSHPSDPLVELVYALKAGYRQNARFVMNRKTQSLVRRMKTATGEYLWAPPASPGAPASLMSFPVVEAEDMPDVAADAPAIAFGDFNRGYLVVDRQGVSVLRDPYSAKPYVLFYTTKRVGGGVQDFDAIKLMKFAVS